jgi:hypothetical protein
MTSPSPKRRRPARPAQQPKHAVAESVAASVERPAAVWRDTPDFDAVLATWPTPIVLVGPAEEDTQS